MTFPQNTPSIDQLINLPAGEIAQLPVELLAALQREIDIPTTITVAQGAPIRVFVARDLDFSGVVQKAR